MINQEGEIYQKWKDKNDNRHRRKFKEQHLKSQEDGGKKNQNISLLENKYLSDYSTCFHASEEVDDNPLNWK